AVEYSRKPGYRRNSQDRSYTWVMRVRSQGEMDSLVHDAGFDKCTHRIDEWGIFTVSMAVRRDN
ncbi:class I SAM-dependent methyltransferase family protein, partial [Pseudomonas aeruginosa]|uniref:class I SAM-dependent methyltransferase family protein n=1 Tax=Pseudomonas aeruginosa TaxID=287 RepID=UPI003CF579A7